MLAGLVIALLAAADLGGPAGGVPIVSVRVVRFNVFDISDPSTSAWPYRAANALHVVTRERFIRSLLLFEEGDPLDPAALKESERLLRATGVLQPVRISARAVEGGAEVTVETHDQWTLEASIAYGRYGDRENAGFTVSDDNLLGWGKTLELEYRDRPERNTTMLRYLDPLLLGSRWRLSVARTEASDGSEDALALEYPFFAFDTRRAGGVGWLREKQTDHLWSRGSKVVSGAALRRDFRLWAGRRIETGGDATRRLTLAAFGEAARFEDWRWQDGEPYPKPLDRDLAGFEVGWEHQTERWEVVQGFRALVRQEDVPLGPNWRVGLGVSLPAFGGDFERTLVRGDVVKGWLTGTRYTWLKADVSGRFDRSDPNNVLARFEAGTAQTGSQGLRARVALDLGHDLDGDRQLTLGANVGLRGWEPDTFDGTSRAVANLEWRRQITGEVLRLGVIGIEAFADFGASWRARVGPDSEGLRADAGVGLLVDSTRASFVRIIRLEVVLPDDGSGPLFLLVGGPVF
ncbi:MAG: hypothetical protein AB1625_15495 [Acidobacteriota bacterium]